MSCMNRIGYTCHGSENYGKTCKAKLRCSERKKLNKAIALKREQVREMIGIESMFGVGVRA